MLSFWLLMENWYNLWARCYINSLLFSKASYLLSSVRKVPLTEPFLDLSLQLAPPLCFFIHDPLLEGISSEVVGRWAYLRIHAGWVFYISSCCFIFFIFLFLQKQIWGPAPSRTTNAGPVEVPGHHRWRDDTLGACFHCDSPVRRWHQSAEM